MALASEPSVSRDWLRRFNAGSDKCTLCEWVQHRKSEHRNKMPAYFQQSSNSNAEANADWRCHGAISTLHSQFLWCFKQATLHCSFTAFTIRHIHFKLWYRRNIYQYPVGRRGIIIILRMILTLRVRLFLNTVIIFRRSQYHTGRGRAEGHGQLQHEV